MVGRFVAAAVFACLSPVLFGTTTTLTMDEIARQPVNGLSFQGVTFDFRINSIGSPDALYNSGGPGPGAVAVNDPSIEGNALGILTMSFATPTPILQFGVALLNGLSIHPGVAVELFDSLLNSLGIFPLNLDRIITFSEGQFDYTGTAVSKAVVDFEVNPAIFSPRFALDNLTYSTDGQAPAPGDTPTNPLLPSSGNPGTGFGFDVIYADPDKPIFIDPLIAVGYEYSVSGGMSNFASVLIPSALPNGDFQFQVEFNGVSHYLEAGVPFDFLGFDPLGFSTFRITGINTDEMLDPLNPTAFVTGLTFVSAGSGQVFQNPLTVDVGDVPEPATWMASALGLGALLASQRRRRARVIAPSTREQPES